VYEVVGAGSHLVASNNYGIHRSEDGGERWRHVYKTEALVFVDLVAMNGVIYGGTREWRETRGKSEVSALLTIFVCSFKTRRSERAVKGPHTASRSWRRLTRRRRSSKLQYRRELIIE
jgi:hypothetical protein